MAAITVVGPATTPAPLRPSGARRPGAARSVRALQLRRRRRRAAAIALAALLAGGWALGVLGGGPLTVSEDDQGTVVRAASAVDGAPSRSGARLERVYVVQQGDTLWSIARRAQPRGDVRPLVDALAAARQGRPLQPGERLVLP